MWAVQMGLGPAPPDAVEFGASWPLSPEISTGPFYVTWYARFPIRLEPLMMTPKVASSEYSINISPIVKFVFLKCEVLYT